MTDKQAWRSRTGKFGSVVELEAAYEALEAAFTKRCQQLAALKKAYDELVQEAAAWQDGKSVEEVIQEREAECYKAARQEALALIERERTENERKIAEILHSSEWKNKVIEEYLKELGPYGMPVLLSASSGNPSLTPVRKPSSLKEAKALADYLLARS